ncbi:16S rRNA (guanine(527)-N(7))-methyltransferase RsmG [bacterium]|nr:16S rRNA (guanine(527)-N(7))-methyltransferase RsmG [bacterium]
MTFSDEEDYKEVLMQYLSEMSVCFTDEDIFKILFYLEAVYEFNKITNIVGSKEKKDIFYRHIIDCLSIFSLKEEFSRQHLFQKKILDIGSGAGLPGILLSILLKNNNICLIEKNHKKANFLSGIIKELHLPNTTVLNYPAEQLAREDNFRESFDYCIARAVTKINILLELIIPFSKINGKIFLYKSRKVFLESEKITENLRKLGSKISRIEEINIPCLDEFRAILILDKQEKTSAIFPRDMSLIKKDY